MKFRLLLLLGLVTCFTVRAQDNMYSSEQKPDVPEIYPLPDFPFQDGEVVYQTILEFDANQQALYGIALKYVSDYYKSAKSVIDISDPVNGLVIVKGIFPISSDVYFKFFGTQKTTYEYLTYHTLKIECKDKKIRITIDNLLAVTEANASLGLSRTETPITYMIEQYGIYETFKKPNKREMLGQVNRSALLHEMHINAYGFLLGLEPYFSKELEDDW